jgi:mannose-6-phosphate isomerase-like protein (cupin superfamily)
MRGFVANIEKDTLANNDFRRVLYTARNSQLVLMSIPPGEEIGEETHDLDQFLRVERGEGKVELNGEEHGISDGSAIVVPAGVRHNVVNTGGIPLQLYSIYSPPEHKDGTVHATKADAREEHFDGRTTE